MKKYLQIALMIFFVSAVFTSCKDDDDDDEEAAAVEAYKLENEKAFAAKANDPDYFKVVVQGSGDYFVYAKKLKEGDGVPIYYTSHVKTYYRGWLATETRDNYFDKKEFEDGEPLECALSTSYATTSYTSSGTTTGVTAVITGWAIALQHMRVGDKWEVWIPQQLGYGSTEQDDIPAYSTLVFEIEVVERSAIVGG